jgi:flagellin
MVGGVQGSALMATAAGLGIDGLTASSQALQIGLGKITENTDIVGTGDGTTASTLTVQTQSWNSTATSTDGTAGNPAQKWVFVFDDGSSIGSTQDNINGVINTSGVTAGTGTTIAGQDLGTAAGGTEQVTFINDDSATATGGIALAKNLDGSTTTNGSITDLGNGNTVYTFVDAADANGNATQQTNIVRVNIKNLTTAAAGSGGVSDNQADIITAFSKLAAVMQQVGFSATIDTSNNLLIAGNDVDTRDHDASGTAAIANFGADNAGTEKQVTDARGAIANIDAAINSLGTISSTLGAATNHITGMQTFTTTLSQALTAGVGALTDADLATESAKLQSLQTKQQLGIQSLSIANQQPQALLKLFG